MSDTVNGAAMSNAQIDYLYAAHVAMDTQPPDPPPPAMRSDQQATAAQGSASPAVDLADPWGNPNPGPDEPVYRDDDGTVYTRREIESMEREADEQLRAQDMARKIGNYTVGGVNIATGAYTGVRAVRAIQAARAASAAGKVLTVGGKLAGGAAGKVLPVIGAALSINGIYSDVKNWNAPENHSHVDDVARIGGDAATVVGTAMLFTPAAPIGLGVMAAGFIINGIGSIFDD